MYLVSFAVVAPPYGSPLEPDCGHFAIIYDPDTRRKVKVCSGMRRTRNVYVSSNKSVELYFKRVNSRGEDQRLLVQFTGQDNFSQFRALIGFIAEYDMQLFKNERVSEGGKCNKRNKREGHVSKYCERVIF